ncbi:MAG: DUF3305 domain-containing protein [Pseudomonadota bacterium]
MTDPQLALSLGIVIRRAPSASRWAKWSWRAEAVLPGAGPADWAVLREEGEATLFHAATVPLELFRTDTEAYLTGLAAQTPTIGVVMRDAPEGATGPLDVVLATASPYDLQDYQDSGEEIVELVPMPAGLIALIRDFCAEHHVEETFKKRKRDRVAVELVEDGIGDPRIRQTSDVYRAPRRATVH